MSRTLTRRGVLRGMVAGSAVTIGVPFLDGFLNESGTALAATGAPLPVRFGTWFWGLGLTPGRWMPEKLGADYDLPFELRPMQPFRKKISVLSGFDVRLDGAPNFTHATGAVGVRTGSPLQEQKKAPAPSVDVLIADAVGHGTRFRSLDVNTTADPKSSYSYRADGQPNPSEPSPLELYLRVFGAEFQDPGRAEFVPDPRLLLRQSALSGITDQRQHLERQLGAADKARLDQYFTSLRQLENQLELQLQKPPPAEACAVPARTPTLVLDTEIRNVQTNHKIMSQILAMALACNQTKIFNMVFTQGSSQLRSAEKNAHHHTWTHEEAIDRDLGYQPISTWFVERSMEAWASFVAALDAVPEGNGTLLDNCLVMAHSDTLLARAHNIQGIPMFLAGSAGGRVRTGHHIAGNSDPVTRVGLTVQKAMGIQVNSWGTKSMQTAKPLSELLV